MFVHLERAGRLLMLFTSISIKYLEWTEGMPQRAYRSDLRKGNSWSQKDFQILLHPSQQSCGQTVGTMIYEATKVQFVD